MIARTFGIASTIVALVTVVALAVLPSAAAAAPELPAPRLELAPGTRYDPAIPTLRQVLGYEIGDEITTPPDLLRYLEALHAAAPDRSRLIEYGRTWEGRPLVVFVVGAPERIANLDAVAARLRRLAEPRGLEPAAAERLIAELPVAVWLLHAVHGNEISSADAALYEAYHLLAAEGDATVDAIRRETLALIDPLENPDGRARFLAGYALARPTRPDGEPLAAEHDEPWPRGRSNHYLFDMNRDWFAASQPETRGRLAFFLRFYPQVVVDLHEMDGDSTYYFAPPAGPENPHVTPAQHDWLIAFGRANAARFDERGFAYFTRETFDSFYPGYGESWPMFHGAVGMTYEQASPRGLVWNRQDGTRLTYRQAVTHHFTAALTTLATSAAHRTRLLADFLAYRQSAVAEGERGGVREYLLPPGGDPARTARLATLLATQGIEVRRAVEPLSVGAGAAARTLPAGTFVVPAAQPARRLVHNLLDPSIAMDAGFVEEQDRRRKKRLPEQFYDLTGWSLPLAWDVEVVTADRAAIGRQEPFVPQAGAAPATPSLAAPTAASSATSGAALTAASSVFRGAAPGTAPGVASGTAPATSTAAGGAPPLPAARVGYLVPWGTAGAAAIAEALADGLAVVSADRPFTLAGVRYGIGTALLRTAANPADLPARLGEILARHGVAAVPVASGWVDDGISLGSNDMLALAAPRVLLAWDRPAQSTSAGWARFVLERRFGQAVTIVRSERLGELALADWDVLVLPAGDYGRALGEEGAKRLADWVRAGGTLITLADATRWAAGEKVGLLSTTTELRGGRPETGGKEGERPAGPPPPTAGKPFDLEQAIQPEREPPESTPGALLRVTLDPEHWLAAGSDGEIQAVVEGRRVVTPIKLDRGANVGLFAAPDRLLASGLAWKEAQEQLARKAYLIDQPLGDGHLIAFAEDPNYRAFAEATELLFINAVLLGPAH